MYCAVMNVGRSRRVLYALGCCYNPGKRLHAGNGASRWTAANGVPVVAAALTIG